MPAALLIDLFDTLVDDGGSAARDDSTRAMADLLGVDREAYLQLYDDTWQLRLTGVLGGLPMIAKFAAELGASPSLATLQAASDVRTDFTGGLLAGVPSSTLAALRDFRAGGYKIAVVSNCTSEVAQVWPTSPLAPYVDAVALSCELGVGKPDPAIYLAATAALGVEPRDCVFLGDGAGDELRGAAKLGMRAVRTFEFSDTDPTWTGETVASIAELAALIGRPG